MNNKNNSWPTGIFIFYVLFMIVLVAAVIFSTRNNIELVTNNYYEKTLLYEDQILAIKNTQSLAEKPVVGFDKVRQFVFLLMPKVFMSENIAGTVYFFRPSDASLDYSISLECDGQNQQIFPLKNSAPGKWKVQIEWTDGSKKYYYEQVIFI